MHIKLGADYIATGHYAQIRKLNGICTNYLKAEDGTKDQSYFLYRLKSETANQHIYFLLGIYINVKYVKSHRNINYRISLKRIVLVYAL